MRRGIVGTIRFSEAALAVAGDSSDEPQRIALCAGPLTLFFEPKLAFLRYCRLGRSEVLRGVYAAVRDPRWGTVPPRVIDLELDDHEASFRLTFHALCREGDIDFAWRGTIRGEADGTVEYVMDGAAQSTFLAARIGFCVLHPLTECAGRTCVIEKTSGALECTSFPLHIAPRQPFLNVRAIGHEVVPGLSAEVRCEGEVFETEDQRNWGDGSFKTYCHPLDLPGAIELHVGDTLHQSVTLSLRGATSRMPRIAKPEPVPVSFEVHPDQSTSGPTVGVQMTAGQGQLAGQALVRLRSLRLQHLRVDLALSQMAWPGLLAEAASTAAALDAPLEVALSLGGDADAELADLLDALRRLRPRVRRWLVFQEGQAPAPDVLHLARSILGRYDSGALLGSGSDVYFAELNRRRPVASAVDLVCYPVTPQVHAFDNPSIAETLPVLAAQLESVRTFCGALPIAVTPITLRPRPGKGGGGPPPTTGLPPDADRRQASLFAAGWTLGSYKYLAAGGARSVTYYETSGWRGLMNGASVFPVYYVISELAEWADGKVLATSSSDPLSVEGVAFAKGGSYCAMLANLTDCEQQVILRGLRGPATLSYLDETNIQRATAEPEAYRATPGTLVQADDRVLQLTLPRNGIARVVEGHPIHAAGQASRHPQQENI